MVINGVVIVVVVDMSSMSVVFKFVEEKVSVGDADNEFLHFQTRRFTIGESKLVLLGKIA